MESFTLASHEDQHPEVIPGLEIVPPKEEKPKPSISDIEGGLEIIRKKDDGEDDIEDIKTPTLH